jgi:hypothetical protein
MIARRSVGSSGPCADPSGVLATCRHPTASVRQSHVRASHPSTYQTRAGPRRLWQCGACGRCVSERRGTAFFNLKAPEVEVCRSLDAMLRGDTHAWGSLFNFLRRTHANYCGSGDALHRGVGSLHKPHTRTDAVSC